MATRIPQLQRFFHSHYFFSGLRQAVGVLLPALSLSWLFNLYSVGIIASVGAACVAILDQPGGPRRYGTNGMLGAILLGSVTAAITGLASSHQIAIWMLVPILCFLFSMFTVFGKQGGLLGLACLLIMTLTMRTPLTPHDVFLHTIWSFLGGLFYFGYSYLLHRLFWHREEQQALSVALFATADYIATRSTFYDMDSDLEDSYRRLIPSQAAMTESHQAAREMILRELPRGQQRWKRFQVSSLNVFIDMVALMDTMVATHTDYATLRRVLPDSDVLLFARDALQKTADNVSEIALTIARNRVVKLRSGVKAELRAIEYELEKYKRKGLADTEPEVYALLVQILRRLRNAARIVARMATHTHSATATTLVDQRLDNSLGRFLSRQEFRPGLLTSNLRLDSPHFRYALRVATAALLAMSLSAALAQQEVVQKFVPGMTSHSYWIILTIIIIMKPGFALTRQRNGKRLAGTLIGCCLALVLFNVTDNLDIYLLVLVVTSILGYSLIQLNYMISGIFNTLFVLLVFHFLSPGSNFVIGERLMDTFIGCMLALLCSYILPWWEYNFMASLAAAAKKANHEFLKTGLQYADLSREKTTLDPELHEADMRWRVARKNAYIAFSNFASAFYRMMDEPIRRQHHVPELNHLLIQNHVLASQISAAVPILATLPTVPEGIAKSLDAIELYMQDQDADPPVSIETEGELAALAYPMRQMVKAAQLIRQEMRGLAQMA